MRVVVVGATGNVGSALVRALGADSRVEEIIGVARRLPHWLPPKTMWVPADVTNAPLEPIFVGADAVVHLAWVIQPSHDERRLAEINVAGSQRVFEAAVHTGVPALIYASSVGVYSPGPKDRRVDEDWPRNGIPTSSYGRQKAETERMLDAVERENPALRVVRLRPGLTFQRSAGFEIRKLFIGRLVPARLIQRTMIPVIPDMPGLALQVAHAEDVAAAYHLAVTSPNAKGAYNIAAEPVLDPPRLADLLGARRVRVPPRLLRGLASLTWHLRLQPTPPGWLDLGLYVPLLDTTRAREELGWTPRHDAGETLLELLDGIRDRAGADTPPLGSHVGS